MRILIELIALEKTVSVITSSDMEELERIAEDLDNPDSQQSWIDARQAFYKTLYSIGNTPRTVSIIIQPGAEANRYTMDLDHRLGLTHRAFLDSIRLGDAQLAAVWLETHLREVARERKCELTPPDRSAPFRKAR